MTPSPRGHGQVKRWAWLWLLWLSLAGALSPAHAGAAALAQDDVRAVRTVIRAQVDAFAADDAERAFSYASATIRTQFGDAATFMAMVRAGYPMVVLPATVAFFLARDADGRFGRWCNCVTARVASGKPPTSLSGRPTPGGASTAAPRWSTMASLRPDHVQHGKSVPTR
jgi:hypothetical protein